MQNQSQKHRNNHLVSFVIPEPRTFPRGCQQNKDETPESFMIKSPKHQIIPQKLL